MWMELVQYLNLGIDCTSVRQRDCFEPFRVVVSWELPSGSAWCTVTSGSITPKESLQRFTEDMSTKVYFSQHGWWDSTFHRSLATDASVVGNTWFRLSGCCQAARILDMFFFTSTHFWHLWVPKFAWLWKTNAFYYLILYLFISHRSYCHINIYIRIYIYTPYIYIYISTINISYDHTKTSSNIFQHVSIQHPISQFLPFFQKASSRPQRSFTPEPQRAAPLPPRRTLPPPPPSLAEPASAPLLGTPRTWLDAPKRCNLTFKTVVEVRFIQIPCVGDSSKRWWRFNDA